MDIFQSIILGIVEGITEFLPISSTGHLILTSKLLGIERSDFLKTFEISIQLGAILAVVFLYWRKFLLNFEILKRVLTAFLPTAIGGLALYKIFKNILLENETLVLAALFFGGIFLIIFELLHKEKETAISEVSSMSYLQSFCIGLIQLFSMVPGVSRAAATIVGGMTVGLKRKTVVEFSFLLAVPTMASATLFDFYNNHNNFTSNDWLPFIIGFIVSFVVAIFAIKWLMKYIQNHNFIAFGIYRIIISLFFWLIIF